MFVLQAWVYSYFPGFAPQRTEEVPREYPVVKDWIVCRRKSQRSSYDVCRRGVNTLQLEHVSSSDFPLLILFSKWL